MEESKPAKTKVTWDRTIREEEKSSYSLPMHMTKRSLDELSLTKSAVIGGVLSHLLQPKKPES